MIQKATENLLKRLFIFPFRNLFILLNGLFKNFDSTIWILSDGRSGSTWVSSLLNNKGNALQVFEPFHPEVNNECNELTPYTYYESLSKDSKVIKTYSKVFSGKLLHRRANFDNRGIIYSGMVVKDVFACLSSYAIHQHFKEVKVIILLRNPFDVVRSKERTAQRGWLWPTDLSVYTSNKSLLKRMNPQQILLIDKIAKNGNFIEKQMVHWTLSYFIMLNSFASDSYYLLFYEKMESAPSEEAEKIRRFLGKETDFDIGSYTSEQLEKASRTLKTSSQDSNWESKIKNTFQESELKTMKELIECFSLTKLYGLDGLQQYSDGVKEIYS